MGMNISNQTEWGFIAACEMGYIGKAKDLLGGVNPQSLLQLRTLEERTCVHLAVLSGDSDLLQKLEEKIDLKEIIKTVDSQGDTALHVAVRVHSMNMVAEVLKLDATLCNSKNNRHETPLNIAIRLQFLKAVEFLLPRTQSALEDESKFLLHTAVSLNQVKLVEILIKFLHGNNILSNIINLPYQPATNAHPIENYVSSPLHDDVEEGSGQKIIAGDSPLHIAARNKYDCMVELLVAVPGLKKHALNAEGKTAVDIARQVIEYHESFWIIRKLGDFERKGKSFMYCAPQVSYEKHKRAVDVPLRRYDEKRNTEVVVAALLAAMTFTAAFSAPGGFITDTNQRDELGIPVLFSLIPFKVFYIFNSIAFFLALFSCVLWELMSDFVVVDKLLFLTVNGIIVCVSFGFTAFGFMCALLAVLNYIRVLYNFYNLGL